MKHSILIGGLVVALGAAGVVTYISSSSDHSNHMMNQSPEMNRADTTPMGHEGHDMMEHNMIVRSEREFITLMIPHHQEAIDAAKRVLEAGGVTPEVKTLAEQIIIAQEKEITDLQTWHSLWYGEPYQATTAYLPMMRDLSVLTGAELDRAFLEDMIPHHEGAITMAESVKPHTTREELRSLVEVIITTQTAEIELMKQLLESQP